MFTQIVTSCLEGIFQISQSLGFPSYALAIIVIALIIRIVLLPLNLNQMRSTIAMQQIQPQMQELQKKYASNPEVLNQKMMELYKDYDVNPLSGCLPTLIQFPILIGIYQGLRAFVPAYPEYYDFFWIPDLGEVDTTHIMVVLVGVSTFLQSLIITGKPTQFMQKYMLIAMPLMMAWMAAKFPAFLCVYWLAITVISILQQLLVTKPMKKKLQERQAALAEEKKQKLEERKQAGKGRHNARREARPESPAKAEKPAKPEKAEKPEKAAAEPAESAADGAEAPKKHRRRRR